MSYKVLDLFKDLPGTNCGDCGKPGCFAFATAVYLEAYPLERCPHLGEAGAAIRAKLEADRAEGGGRKPDSSEQALEHLRGVIAGRDLAEVAERCGGRYHKGPPEAVEVAFLGIPHRILRDDVVAEGEAPTVWVKILLLIYATRATGRPPAGEWIAFRELPNSVSKAKSFEASAARITDGFAGESGALAEAVGRVGGRPVEHPSAPQAFRIDALPRVPLLLLFWPADEEFGARATLLVDRGVLDYLDQEALVFLSEALAQKLLGGDLAEVMA